MRKNELARTVGVTPAALSQYELGQSRPSPGVLSKLALALGMSVDFFILGRPTPVTPSAAHFRSLRATTQLEREQAMAFGEIAWRLMVVIENYVDLPVCNLPHLRLSLEPSNDDICRAAREVRESIGIGAGPVSHVVRMLEAYGVVVLVLPKTSRRVDAFSHWYGARPVVFLNPLKNDRPRSRFDAAHELGHLILHHDAEPGNRVIENQAQDFAAEFLTPREEIIEELPLRLEWDQLHNLKRRWGISLKALIYRAHRLGIFGESTYRRGMMTLAQWGDPEPGNLGPRESPIMLSEALRILIDSEISINVLAQETGLAVDMIQEIMAAADSDRPRLNLSSNLDLMHAMKSGTSG